MLAGTAYVAGSSHAAPNAAAHRKSDSYAQPASPRAATVSQVSQNSHDLLSDGNVDVRRLFVWGYGIDPSDTQIPARHQSPTMPRFCFCRWTRCRGIRTSCSGLSAGDRTMIDFS